LNASSVRIAEGPNPFLLDWGLCTQRNATQRYATLRYVDRKLPNNIAQ